jgi:hypothetical protein
MAALPAYVNPNAWAGAQYSPAQALDLTTLQNAIVAQINSVLSANPAMAGIVASGWADDQENRRMSAQKGDVLVIFSEGSYERPDSTSAIAQRRTLEWEVTTRARGLGWQDAAGVGLYALLEQLRQALTGFRAPGILLPGMWPRSEKLLGRQEKEGVWVAVMTYAMDVLAVAEAQDYTLPSLTKAQINETVTADAAGDESASATYDAAAQAVAGGGNAPKSPSN